MDTKATATTTAAPRLKTRCCYGCGMLRLPPLRPLPLRLLTLFHELIPTIVLNGFLQRVIPDSAIGEEAQRWSEV